MDKKKSNVPLSNVNQTYKPKRSSRNKKKSFWDDGLSIDETKISCLILCLLAGMVYVGIAYMINGDVSTNLADIIIALIYAVASINVASSLDNLINNRNQIKLKQMEYDHEIDMQELNNSSTSNDDYIDI